MLFPPILHSNDIGYGYTKDSNMVSFESAYFTSDKSIIGTKPLKINDKTYYVGNGGNVKTCDANKAESELNMVMTIYDLILNDLHDNILLGVGLPITQYTSQKDQLKNAILSYNDLNVEFDNEPYYFHINDVQVCYQGISSLYTLPSLEIGDYIVVDIGSLSVDIAHVEISDTGTKVLKVLTLYTGVKTIFTDIIDVVNNKYDTKFHSSYVDKILREGCLKINGECVKLDFLKDLLQNYIDEIAFEIKLKLPYECCSIYVCGGIAPLIHKVLSNRFRDVKLIPDYFYSNALGYNVISYFKFKQKGLIK